MMPSLRSTSRSPVVMHQNQASFDRIQTLRDCEDPLQIETNTLILDA
jgi:hypothetical protein